MINDKEVLKTVMKMLFKTCCNRCKIHTKNVSRQPHAIVSSTPRNKTPFFSKTFQIERSSKRTKSVRIKAFHERTKSVRFSYCKKCANSSLHNPRSEHLAITVPKNVYIIWRSESYARSVPILLYIIRSPPAGDRILYVARSVPKKIDITLRSSF